MDFIFPLISAKPFFIFSIKMKKYLTSPFTFVRVFFAAPMVWGIETGLKCIGGNVEHQGVISPSGLQVCVALCFLTCTPAVIMSDLVHFTVYIAQDDNHRIGRVGRGLSDGCCDVTFPML